MKVVKAGRFHLWRDRGATTLVEFAIVGPVFLLLLFAILGVGLDGFYQLTLDDAVRDAARQIQIDGAAATSPAGFANAVCTEFAALAHNCANSITFSVQASPLASGFAALTPAPLSSGGAFASSSANGAAFFAGTPYGDNDNVLVQVAYPLPFKLPYVGNMITKHVDRQHRRHRHDPGRTVLIPNRFCRLIHDRASTAALEFALIVPVMVVLFLGAIELTNIIRAQQKLNATAGQFVELVAGQSTVTEGSARGPGGTLGDMCAGAAMNMLPYNPAYISANIGEDTATQGFGVNLVVQWVDASSCPTVYSAGGFYGTPALESIEKSPLSLYTQNGSRSFNHLNENPGPDAKSGKIQPNFGVFQQTARAG